MKTSLAGQAICILFYRALLTPFSPLQSSLRSKADLKAKKATEFFRWPSSIGLHTKLVRRCERSWQSENPNCGWVLGVEIIVRSDEKRLAPIG